MKTLKEIKDYCKNSCGHKDCKGKFLKFTKKHHKFCGQIIIPANSWFCDYPK